MHTDDLKPKNLATFTVTMEDGKTKAFLVRAAVRQGDHILEFRDAETKGEEVWTIFKLPSAPKEVHLSTPHVAQERETAAAEHR
jgi:hypothetical protein